MKTTSRWLALVVLCVAELLVTIDNTIVNVALPTLSRELSASTSGLQWIVDAYTLVFTGLLLAAGHLGDRLGRRRVLLVGLLGFGGVSVAAATVGTLGELVASRAVMGAFAALIFPATLAIVTNVFTEVKERVAAVGIWSAVAGVSVALGPVTGGWLLEHFSWHSVFWVNVPIALAAVAATVRWVPESRAAHADCFDLLGALLSIGGLTTLVWSVIEGPQHGWTSPIGLVGFAAAAALLGLFVVRELNTPAPLLDVRLFTNARFSAAAGAISIAFFGLFGFIFLITQYFQAVKGYSTLEAGVRTLPFALVIGALAPVAVQLAQRIGTTVVVSGGLALMSGGFALAGTAGVDASYFGVIISAMVLMAMGLGLITGPATEAVMGALPLHQAGAGSAVNDTTRELGGTLGVAVLGSVLASIYGSKVADALHGLPVAAHDAATKSVIGGLRVAGAANDAGLAAAVRQAFVEGLHTASFVAAAATLVGAVIVAFALPARAQTVATAPRGAEPQPVSA